MVLKPALARPLGTQAPGTFVQASAGPAQSYSGQAWRACPMLTLWNSQVVPGTFTPQGGASQGQKDSNPRFTVLEAVAVAAVPCPFGIFSCRRTRKTALRELPVGGSWSQGPLAYPGAILPLPHVQGCMANG